MKFISIHLEKAYKQIPLFVCRYIPGGLDMNVLHRITVHIVCSTHLLYSDNSTTAHYTHEVFIIPLRPKR